MKEKLRAVYRFWLAVRRWTGGKLVAVEAATRQHKRGFEVALPILAAALFAVSSWLQYQNTGLQTRLVYDVSQVAASHGGVGENAANIILYRSIAEQCAQYQGNDPIIKGSCGSNGVLLRIAALQKDPLEGFDITQTDKLNGDLSAYASSSPSYERGVFWTFTLGCLASVLAVLVAVA